MRIYLAGPMRGYPDFNYPAFHEAAKVLRDMGYDVFNPAEAFDGDQSLPPSTYLRHDFEEIVQRSEAMVMLPGWQESAFALHEKAARTGYDFEDVYFYSTGLLRELIPQALDRTLWVEPGVANETGKLSRTAKPEEGGNRVAMLCDVRSGLESGSEADKELLWTTFGLCMPEDEHAMVLGITVEALRTRIHRAVQRLQRRLGGPKPDGPYVGTRRAISNAQAQAITRNQESEE